MAWEKITYKLTSVCPMIFHNGQTADPLNQYARALKQISSKSTKTEADFKEMARIEFSAGLYMSQDGPIIPSYVIDAVIIKAAMNFKKGKQAKSGCVCLDHARLEYDGPRKAEQLWKDERFRFSRLVRVGQARIARMRPIFDQWNAEIVLLAEDTIVNEGQLDEWLYVAGTQVGIGDWRPKYGRFTVERLNGKK